ncbi:MAG TPA: UDP-N-acetylglucosamine 1-carboxyvinyltransferase [Clostridiales bacterium UBA8153]|nr:UDP-N-acetylglucosamine 1-carboxyvinyltransferase [Clostridiales bacterium UBA8153]
MRYVIQGRRRLEGQVRVSGAKNAVLPVMAATVLARRPCLLQDAPDLRDVAVMSEILRGLGARVRWVEYGGRRALEVDPSAISVTEVPDQLMQQMRSSIFLMGPILGRLGRVRISHPGGCAIGPRPIDLHLRGLEALGATIRERYGYIHAEANRLRGREVHLDFPSVGATENVMMAAVLADGVTIIRNAAKEPEIIDLQNFLNGMGARVKGAGLDAIRIEGVEHLEGAEHAVSPDRIETGTFMATAALVGGEIRIDNCIPEHLDAVIAKLRECGVTIREEVGRLQVTGSGRPLPVDVKTLPYPGFPTDMQPQFMVLACCARGTSVITETIFENRFKHVEELCRMGAQIKTEGRSAIVRGVECLSGAAVEATDLRNGAALVMAGLAAEGTTVVSGVTHIDRGYEKLELKLAQLGADIRRE